MSDSMKNAVYLGDIDPNNSILPTNSIRRIILFQLLIWDKIILSDSQFLTDPRLNILMQGYESDEVTRKHKVDDIDASRKGIETLLSDGFIDVALRKGGPNPTDLHTTWRRMKDGNNPVPYLPEDENYVRYLLSLQYGTPTYETNNMAQMFRYNLEKGLECDPMSGGLILRNDDTEKELKQMFLASKPPLFRDILAFMRGQRDKGELAYPRYDRLYNYVYSCYCHNVSTALGCSSNTKFEHIPFHLESGEEFYGNNFTSEQVSQLRPTWALNPEYLDYMTFEEFAELRRKVNRHLPKVRQFYIGNLTSDWADVRDAWEDYTERLEDSIKLIMHKKKDLADKTIHKETGMDKFITSPKQYTLTTAGTEVVKSVVSFIPVVGSVVEGVDTATGIFGSISTLSKMNNNALLANEYKKLEELTQGRVITRYNDPFKK